MAVTDQVRIKKLPGNLYLCAAPSQKLRFLSAGEYSFLSEGKPASAAKYKDLAEWLKENARPPGRRPHVQLETLYLEITDLCNLRCSYCINEAARSKAKQKISVSAFRSVVSDFVRLGGRTVILSGGEPLLHPDIVEFAGFLRTNGLRTIIKTNGTIFNEKTRLLCGMGAAFDVSLDGAKAETHDQYRGAGSFDRTLRSLRAIKASGGSLNLCSIVLGARNIGREGELIALAERLGFEAVSFTLVMRSGKHGGDADAASQITMGKALVRLFRHKLRMRGRINVQGSLFGEALGILTYGGQRMCYGCSIGRVIKVSADGSVFSCPYFSDPRNSIGNIKLSSLRRLAGKGGGLESQVSELFSRRDRIPKCAACFWKDFCGGGCAVEADGRHGTTLAPDGSCKSRDILFGAILGSLYTGRLKL